MFDSVIPEVKALRFAPMPVKTVAVTKIARTANHVCALAKDGTILSNHVDAQASNCFYPIGYDGYYSRCLMTCAVKLGVVRQAKVTAHWRDVESRKKASAKVDAANQLRKLAKRAGVELTKTQLKAIEKQCNPQ